VAFPELVKHLLLLLFDLLVGFLLLRSRPPAVPPRGARDVLVPLVGNFFYLAYNLAGFVPPALTVDRVPSSWRFPLSLLALHLSVLAVMLAVWAVIHLGRSFAVLVSVREVVLHGPYRFVRHPIYLSYLLQMISLVCAYGSLLVLGLATVHLGVTLWRARLEEARLAAHSAEYRDYMRRTGFLLPKLRP
jgi:protein-S-isoprenylcysteine O-methyltransferase Ste14